MAREPEPRPRTGTLWLVLAFLLFVGTVASAFLVYGVTGLAAGAAVLPDLPIAIVGGFIALFALLMLAGILYRVDRLRGVPHREVRLFE